MNESAKLIYPTEIWIRIFNFLQLKDLIRMELLSSLFKDLIRNYKWDHEIIINNINDKTIFETHHFINFVINDDQINDRDLIHLANAQILDLRKCYQITDVGLQYLTNIQVLNLKYCHKITDAGLQYLVHIPSLCLFRCDKITEAGLQYLEKQRNSIQCDAIKLKTLVYNIYVF